MASNRRPRSHPHPPSVAPHAPPRVVSLERALSKLGVASRGEARGLIAAGRVRVGRQVVTDPRRRVDPARDLLVVDDQPVQPARLQHWMLHKPVGVVTTRRDPQGRPTVYDLLPAGASFMGAVGRLDLDSSGLLLFTNETQLAAALTDPRSHVEKIYEVRLDGPIDAAAARALERGVDVLGKRTLPARAALCGPAPCARLRVTLVEGRNRQVRRMCAALGRVVVELHRVAVGPVRLGSLGAGEARRLTRAEVAGLRAAVQAERERRVMHGG